jgi:hypothetical protein
MILSGSKQSTGEANAEIMEESSKIRGTKRGSKIVVIGHWRVVDEVVKVVKHWTNGKKMHGRARNDGKCV